MQTPKQWLLANGHIKEITRGRMSRENIDRIKAAVSNGAQIEGYGIKERVSLTGEESASEVERIVMDPNKMVDVPDATRDESAVMAFRRDGAKIVEIGMRTVCNACHSSLTYCGCESPRVWIDHTRECVVNFKSRPQ